MATTWNERLVDQLAFQWEGMTRPYLDGLSDGEYLWEPVAGAWSVRPRADATTPMAAGGGAWVVDFAFPEPDPAPFTTIAWRLAHVIVGVFGTRNASHFGGPAMDYDTYEWSPTASGALEQLDDAYERWITGVRALGEDGLERAVGEAEGSWAEHSYAELVLHINREALHHTAEVLLLRDLYRHQPR